MDKRKLLIRLARGQLTNVAFGDARRLLEGLGFELRRVSGSHHVFAHPTSRSCSTSSRFADRQSRINFGR